MKFEDMQVIWDSQNERTMYQFDEQALLSSIQKRSRSIANMVSRFEIMITVILVGLIIMLLIEPLLEHKEYYQIPAAILWAGVVVFIWRHRRTRQKTEAQFDQSVLGMLDRSIYQLGYKLSLTRSFRWWFICPMVIGMVVYMPFVDQSKPIWLWPAMLVCIAGCYLLIDRKVLRALSPLKTELETLRQKLVDAHDTHRA